MTTYIQENSQQGFICKSSSTAGAVFLVMKKKPFFEALYKSAGLCSSSGFIHMYRSADKNANALSHSFDAFDSCPVHIIDPQCIVGVSPCHPSNGLTVVSPVLHTGFYARNIPPCCLANQICTMHLFTRQYS